MKKEEIIIAAESLARKAHKGQKQVTGKPYFEHPLEVSIILRSWNQDEEVISAGYLHDVVEDCNIPLAEIKKMFGKKVAFLVDGMSWVRSNKTGKKEYEATYAKFAKYAKKEPSLVLIKMADMLSNLPNIHVKSHRGWAINKSYPRIMKFYIPFARAVGLSKYAKKVIGEYGRYTKKKIKSVLYDYISKKDIVKIKERLK